MPPVRVRVRSGLRVQTRRWGDDMAGAQKLTGALPALRVDAEAGDVDAQYRLGVLYDDGG